jgi:nucleotide-binding universal stress UspA family protein
MDQTFPVLVGYDLSETGGYVFEQSVHLARRVPNSVIHFLHVTKGDTSQARIRQLGGELQLYVSDKAASMGGLAGLRVGVHVREGDPVKEIVQFAAEVDAALIVLGTSKHPRLKMLGVGTVVERLLPHAPCPVLLAGPVPTEPRTHYPAIEPACPDCLRVRKESNGETWWCERHTSHGASAHGHVYSYQRELPLTIHDSEVIPTGIRF